MSGDLFISQSCLIEKNKAILNGAVVFDKPGLDAQDFLMAMYKDMKVNYPKFYKMDNLCKLGFLAAEKLFEDTAVINQYQKDDIAIVLYNANASLDADRQYYDTVSGIASPALFIYTLPNILIGELCIRHGIKGESIFFLKEKFDAAGMVDYVRILMELDIAKACLCGWVDILGNDYKACLLWVEKNKSGDSFSVDLINRIYNQGYGKINA